MKPPNRFLLLALVAIGAPHLAESSLLNNVTHNVFSQGDLDIMPVAFGDFNSDKLTDLFVVHSRVSKVLTCLTVYVPKMTW